MGRSLGLVFAFVAVLLFVGPARSLVLPTHTKAVQTVSYTSEVRAAGRLTGAAVPAPSGLPDTWQATSARVDGGAGVPVTLHIGFVTPKQQYAALEESNGASYEFLRDLLGKTGARLTEGVAGVGGLSWQVRHDAKGQLALTRVAGKLTIVVTGSASQAELERLAASLRPSS